MAEHGPLVDPATIPAWLRPVVEASAKLDAQMFRQISPPTEDARDAAVLILFGEHETRGPDVLLQLRADGGGAHSGQVAFPGGSAEPEDDGPVVARPDPGRERVGRQVQRHVRQRRRERIGPAVPGRRPQPRRGEPAPQQRGRRELPRRLHQRPAVA